MVNLWQDICAPSYWLNPGRGLMLCDISWVWQCPHRHLLTSNIQRDLSGPPLMLGYRVPLGALATLLSFCEASDALGICSRVCKWFQVAALHSSAWPTLKIRSGAAEQSIDSLCSILMSISTGLQLLTLDLTFQQRDLGVALPGELILRHLQRLELKLNDLEANIFACDLLGCIESPQLRDVKIMAPLTPQLLNAISMTLLPTNGKLNSLKLTALPSRNMEVLLDTGTLTALQELLEITPELSKLMISLEDPSGGLSRYFEDWCIWWNLAEFDGHEPPETPKLWLPLWSLTNRFFEWKFGRPKETNLRKNERNCRTPQNSVKIMMILAYDGYIELQR